MLTRKDIPEFLNQKELIGYGAEIGVLRGEFSKHILEKWKGKKLYLIDSWRYSKDIVDLNNFEFKEQLENYSKTFSNIYSFGDRATIIREFSREASRLFPDNYFDFVFLDARHDFENVTIDLESWYPKVKPDGYLMGHDYLDNITKVGGDIVFSTKFEVKSAVDIFAFVRNLEVYVIEDKSDPFYPSWYIKKLTA
ncbi:MAG: class I SAM-dependent methyltransferase [Candidatus Nanoarchaeia archaeon]|jgi:hypothetical protein|nr:class I SAM-dependent methyltransferase [Candidatus Nanoarchaeia archaeon]